MYHDIPTRHFKNFSSTLRRLRQTWNFIRPLEFERIMRGDLPLERDSLLLTFDDGFYSNVRVARDILEPEGLRAIFFVIPEFIDAADESESFRFVSKRLGIEGGGVGGSDDYVNMRWDDIDYLLSAGHTIGAHSFSHERLTDGLDEEILSKEIIASGVYLEEQVGVKIEHFAFPFGDFSSLSARAIRVAASRYPYIYTGIRGANAATGQVKPIRRDALSPNDSMGLVGALLLGGADFRYRGFNSTVDRWVP